MRINAYLAQQLGISRRQADRIIQEKKVLVNGKAIALGQQLDPDQDRVEVEGRPVTAPAPAKLTIALYKPRTYISSRFDPEGRNTVMSLLPPELQYLKPVGRLDYDSEGLLLMSNDGTFIFESTHPKYQTQKEYRMIFRYPVLDSVVDTFRRGVPLAEGLARVDNLKRVSTNEIEIVVHQGWNRQLRRMADECGVSVARLIRVREGSIRLEKLEPGQWREVVPNSKRYEAGPANPRPPRRRR
jgi:pseudouridine synthase